MLLSNNKMCNRDLQYSRESF